MKKSIRYISIAVVLWGVLLAISAYFLFSFIEFIWQGEYRNYEQGVTIEVNNLSNQSLPSLKFSYSVNQSEFKEVGTIENLNAGDTAQITGSSKGVNTSDTSLYLHYYIDNGGKVENHMIYFDLMQPIKAVVILDIKEVDVHGFLIYEKRGFDGLSDFGPEEIK